MTSPAPIPCGADQPRPSQPLRRSPPISNPSLGNQPTHDLNDPLFVGSLVGQKRHTGLADLHMHTTYSDGVATVEEVLARIQDHTPLDVIAITDHDTIEGALRARDLAAKHNYPFDVIVGEEVSTREGHLLTLFLNKRIPPGLSIERSIELAHAQGGLAIVAHPFHRLFRFSVQREVMERLWRQPEVHPDGVETLNASFAGIGCFGLATRITRERYHWAETGNSDAHTPTAIGSARTSYPGSGVADLRQALAQRQTAAQGGYWRLREYRHLIAYSRAHKEEIAAHRAAVRREIAQTERLARALEREPIVV